MAGKQRPSKARSSNAEKQHLSLKAVVPLTDNQLKVFESDKHQVLHGCAGTGKTYISSYLAYKEMLKGKTYERIIYVRSAVATRSQGFYPGTLEEKSKEYEAPYINIAADLFGRGDAYHLLKNGKQVEFMTTSHIRGLTLRNAIIIADEVQNMNYHELDTIITRPDDSCKMYFCGDFNQADIKDSGIKNFYKILESMNEFNFVDFKEEDIVRGGLVKSYLIAKGKHGL